MTEQSLLRNEVRDAGEGEVDIRQAKITAARNFIERLPKKNILFAGVSGSVSYQPEAEDDIDIFLITKTNKLWSELLKTFIARRLFGGRDICVSLAFDHKYALTYFQEEISGLPLRDSVHVVCIYGDEYYHSLLLRSRKVREAFPDAVGEDKVSTHVDAVSGSRMGVMEGCCFFLLSCWQELKSLYSNSRIKHERNQDDRFETMIGLHRFYLESEKYRRMKRLLTEGEMRR